MSTEYKNGSIIRSENNIKVELIRYPNKWEWLFAKNCALATIGKVSKKFPDTEWKHKILEARHSPIRTLNYAFKMTIPYYISVHLCRHVHSIPFVESQRNDRQNSYDRRKAPQDSLVNMIWYMNAEELMIICNKRLCNKSSPETRAVVLSMRAQVLKNCPEFLGLLVPMCIYHGGKCHEMSGCSDRK